MAEPSHLSTIRDSAKDVETKRILRYEEDRRRAKEEKAELARLDSLFVSEAKSFKVDLLELRLSVNSSTAVSRKNLENGFEAEIAALKLKHRNALQEFEKATEAKQRDMGRKAEGRLEDLQKMQADRKAALEAKFEADRKLLADKRKAEDEETQEKWWNVLQQNSSALSSLEISNQSANSYTSQPARHKGKRRLERSPETGPPQGSISGKRSKREAAPIASDVWPPIESNKSEKNLDLTMLRPRQSSAAFTPGSMSATPNFSSPTGLQSSLMSPTSNLSPAMNIGPPTLPSRHFVHTAPTTRALQHPLASRPPPLTPKGKELSAKQALPRKAVNNFSVKYIGCSSESNKIISWSPTTSDTRFDLRINIPPKLEFKPNNGKDCSDRYPAFVIHLPGIEKLEYHAGGKMLVLHRQLTAKLYGKQIYIVFEREAELLEFVHLCKDAYFNIALIAKTAEIMERTFKLHGWHAVKSVVHGQK